MSVPKVSRPNLPSIPYKATQSNNDNTCSVAHYISLDMTRLGSPQNEGHPRTSHPRVTSRKGSPQVTSGRRSPQDEGHPRTRLTSGRSHLGTRVNSGRRSPQDKGHLRTKVPRDEGKLRTKVTPGRGSPQDEGQLRTKSPRDEDHLRTSVT